MKTQSSPNSKIFNILFYSTALFVILFFYRDCISDKFAGRPAGISKVLKLAGNNKTELTKVLEHYKLTKEEQKLKAAEFLIQNMADRYEIKQELQNKYGDKVEFDFSNFTSGDYIRLSKTLDSLNYCFKQTEINGDVSIITSEYLIDNIDLAFEVWEYPWCKHLRFDQFCDYILPYRCQSEPLTNYRRHFKEKYSWLIDSMQNTESTVEAATILQRHIKDKVKYSGRYSNFFRGFLSPQTMEQVGVGSCEHMANYSVLVFRSCGIPITYDQIVYYQKRDNGHVSNKIIANDGREYVFNLSDDPPSLNKFQPGPTKVLRHTWRKQPQRLWKYRSPEEAPPIFSFQYGKDITNSYCPTTNFSVKINDTITDNIIYLCVFNGGKWNPIYWSETGDENSCSFYSIPEPGLYATMTYNNNNLEMTDHPFILKSIPNPTSFDNTGIQRLTPNYEERIDIQPNIENSLISPISVTGNDTILNLYLWDKGWKLIEAKTHLSKIKNPSQASIKVTYRYNIIGLHPNALYWFGNETRPFTCMNDETIML